MTRKLELAIVQLRPQKGDYTGNLRRLADVFAQITALDPRPALAAFPETTLTGYFLEGGVPEAARDARTFAAELDGAFRSRSAGTLDVVAGFYELHQGTLYNSAMYVTVGGERGPVIAHVHRKVFLPTYGLFDEERFVEHGLDVRAFETPWGRAGLLVCEDTWHAITGTVLGLDGAELVLVLSASPARGAWPQPEEEIVAPASLHRWERLARDRAEEHGIYVAVIQLVGVEGGKLFPGGSVLAGPAGDVRVRAPLWEECVVPVTLDLDDIARSRANSPLLADLRTVLPHMLRALERAGRRGD